MEGLELGAEYRSLGRRLERVVRVAPSRRDKEGSEVGVARRMGMLRLRLSQSELSDALLGNGLRPLGAAFASKAAPLRPIPGTRTLSHPPGRARVQGAEWPLREWAPANRPRNEPAFASGWGAQGSRLSGLQ